MTIKTLLSAAALALMTACTSPSGTVTATSASGATTVTATPAGTVATDVALACQVDGVAQPLAAALVAALVPAAAPAVAADTGLIHPAVVAYCAAKGGVAVTVSPKPAS